jgi:hypothetical protein
VTGPDMTTPEGRAGLTARQGRRSETQRIGDSLIEQGWTVEPDPDDPRSVIFVPPPEERRP